MQNLPVELLYILLEYSSTLSRTCRHLNWLSKELCIVELAGPNAPNLQEFNIRGKGMYERVDNEQFEEFLGALAADGVLARTIRQIKYRDADSVNERVLEHFTKLPNLRTVIIQCTSVLSLNLLSKIGTMGKMHTLNIKSIVAAKQIPIHAILDQCPSLKTLSIDMIFYKHYTEDHLTQLDGVEVGEHGVQVVILRHKLCGKCCCAQNHDAFDLVGVYLPRPVANTLDNKPRYSLVRVQERKTLVDILARVYNWEKKESAVKEELSRPV